MLHTTDGFHQHTSNTLPANESSIKTEKPGLEIDGEKSKEKLLILKINERFNFIKEFRCYLITIANLFIVS